MTRFIKRSVFPLMVAIIFIFSCNTSETSAKEEAEINAMDSTSKAIKDSTERLEEQTKKVEATLEKLDSEFETAD